MSPTSRMCVERVNPTAPPVVKHCHARPRYTTAACRRAFASLMDCSCCSSDCRHVAAAQTLAVSSSDGRRTLTAVRATTPITVDGVLDEAVWQTAAGRPTGFVQSDPLEGQPATEATEVRVAFDDDYLYIGALLPRLRSRRHRRQRHPQGLRRRASRTPSRCCSTPSPTAATASSSRTNAAGRPRRHADRQRGPRRQPELGRGVVGGRDASRRRAGRPSSASRSRRCASSRATATPGASTSRAASAARTRSPTGRRCRAPSRIVSRVVGRHARRPARPAPRAATSA